MKVIVAGCSFSDYMEDNSYVYGDRLAMMLGATYIHEGAGAGSNWRIWRRITKMVLDDFLMPNDIVIIQYTGLERTEFWSDSQPNKWHNVPERKNTITVREPYGDDGGVLRFKSQSHAWHKDREAEFLKMYEEHHVSIPFCEEQFYTQHLMFQYMLKANNIKTIFFYSRHRQQYPLLDHFKLTMFDEGDEFRENVDTYYKPDDNSHLCDKGHLKLAKKMLTHLKDIGWT